MSEHITERRIEQALCESAVNDYAYECLRSLVFGYYYAEVEYTFQSGCLKLVFAVLARYLEFEEAFGDERKNDSLHSVCQFIRKFGISPESVLAGLEFKRIAGLIQECERARVSQDVLKQKLSSLALPGIDLEQVIAMSSD